MDSPFIIPLAVFAMVALIVAITCMAKVRDKELEIHSRLQSEQMEHQRKMKELEMELERARQAN
jgi:hypothetical protein